jgi:hypothetical protein
VNVGIEVKPGKRYRSAVCDAELVVVKAPAGEVDLRSGGHPVVPVDDERPEGLGVEAGFEGELLVGKRYTDEAGTIEVLCTKAGASALSIGDELLSRKDAKPLPSSD